MITNGPFVQAMIDESNVDSPILVSNISRRLTEAGEIIDYQRVFFAIIALRKRSGGENGQAEDAANMNSNA